MDELEWGHKNLTELRLVDDLHQRKRVMLEMADAVVALPGGSGTLEELWLALDPSKLSGRARQRIREARAGSGLAIASITLFELAWLAENGRFQVSLVPAEKRIRGSGLVNTIW